MLISFISLGINSNAQVGIGHTNPDASSMLDVQSPDNNKGMLIPRMLTSQRTAIAAPATGLLVFDTDTQSFWFYSGSWTELATGDPDKIIDTDGDTKVEVEQSADEDKIRFTTLGSERMTIDDVGVTKIGDITGVNYTKIEADGTLEFEGDARVWDDLRVILDKGKDAAKFDHMPGHQGTNAGGQIWYFEDTKDDNMSFSVQLPHSYKEGTTIYPHIHWTPNTDETGDVEWQLHYTWINYQGTFPDPIIISGVTTVNGNMGDHLITDLSGGSGITPTTANDNISSILICKIQRDAGNGNDDYPDKVGALFVDFHFEINTIGSRLPFTK